MASRILGTQVSPLYLYMIEEHTISRDARSLLFAWGVWGGSLWMAIASFQYTQERALIDQDSIRDGIRIGFD